MVATTGYQAGIETTQTILSYAQEAVWGVQPAVQFQNIRYTGETMAGSKTRSRPAEIQSTGEVVQAVTVQEMASGAINYALSYNTFDDFFSGALNASWVTSNGGGVAGDITITAGASPVLSSTTANKFAGIVAGQWIRLFGFMGAGNNGFFRVVSVTDTTHLVLTPTLGTTPVTTETPGTAMAKFRASTITNGTQFKSYWIQQRYSASLFLNYPGSFCTGFTLTGGTGQYFTGSFNFMSQVEQTATVDASTGAVLAAPTGRVCDGAASFGGFLINEAAATTALDSFTITVTATGAAAEYAMGSTTSQGQVMGLVEVKGSVKLYFKDFTMYQRFKSEAQGTLEFIVKDPAGNAYIFTILNGALMNPKIDAGGPSKPVYATFDLEGNPQATGGTIQIDRLPAT